jgi:putative DNA primase/helicase
MAGGYCALHANKEGGPLYVAEGYATAATVHAATGFTVLVAFNAGNLLAVAKQIRTKNPASTVIVAADNDHETETRTGKNPGVEAATAAAKEIKGFLATPIFKYPSGQSDFNDLAQSEGADAVRSCLEKRQKPTATGAFTLEDYGVARFLNSPPPPIRWFFENSMIADTLGLFSAPGGSGKSFFCLQAAMGTASNLPSLDGIFQRGIGAFGKK